jgi:hypothetical protein
MAQGRKILPAGGGVSFLRGRGGEGAPEGRRRVDRYGAGTVAPGLVDNGGSARLTGVGSTL